MQQKEFEALTGITVTDEERAWVEKAYMAAGNVDERKFCAEWPRLRDSEVFRSLVDRSEQLERQLGGARHEIGHFNKLITRQSGLLSEIRETVDSLEKKQRMLARDKAALTLALIQAGQEEEAVKLTGRTYVVTAKCRYGLELTEADRDYIASALQEKKHG